MSLSKYNLRSGCRDPCPSSQVSEETVDGNLSHEHLDGHPTIIATQNSPEIDNVADFAEEVAEEVADEVADEVVASEGSARSHHGIRSYGKVIQTDVLQNVVSSFRVYRSSPPPPVPLCRLVVNEAIRIVKKNVSDLGIAFRMHGYIRELGTFLVSVSKADEPELEVNELDLQEWGTIWRSVNDEFEREVLRDEQWSYLSKKKFFVWDGNHRVQAWMEKIKEVFPTDKEKHVRVECSFLDVAKGQEGELLLALHNINRLTRVFVPHTLAHDIYMMQKFGQADKQTLLKHLPAADRDWMEIEIKRDRKISRKPWYTVPMAVLAQLVYKEEFDRLVHEHDSKLDRERLTLEECNELHDMAVQTIEKSLHNRAYKLSSIANPTNGSGFFHVLYNLDWSAKGLVVTEDKLQTIASSFVSATKKKEVIALLAGDKQQREAIGMSSDNKSFRRYMAKETFWWQMIEMAKGIVVQLSMVDESPQLPDGYEIFFRMQRQLHFQNAFPNLQKDMKNAASEEKQPQILLCSRRLVYRFVIRQICVHKKHCLHFMFFKNHPPNPFVYCIWLVSLIKDKTIKSAPMEVIDWRMVDGPLSMFPPDWSDLGLTAWELKWCPWWLDYPVGQVPPAEKELHASKQAITQGKRPSHQELEHGSSSKRKEFTKQHRRSELRTKRFLDMEAVENSSEPRSPSTDDTEEDASLADRFVQTQEQAIAMQGEVCAILCDIHKFARKKKGRAAKKVHLFCTRNLVAGLTIGTIPTAAAVALVWVNFPTSLGVKHFEDSKSVPSWNLFSPDLAVAAFEIASRYVADQGWFSFACIPEQLPVIHTFAESFGFELFRCLNVLAEVAYTRQDPFEEVVLLHMPLYHRTGCPTPTYQRVAAGRHSKLAFDKKANWIMDLNGGTITEINHVVCRGGAERSPSFFRFLLEMLTKPQDVILDVFAGTGNMGREANKLDRNCVCIEQDELLYETLLLPMESRKD